MQNGSSSTNDVGAGNSSYNETATVSPYSAGTWSYDRNDNLVFTAAQSAAAGTLVTVTYSYRDNGRTYTGSLTFWII